MATSDKRVDLFDLQTTFHAGSSWFASLCSDIVFAAKQGKGEITRRVVDFHASPYVLGVLLNTRFNPIMVKVLPDDGLVLISWERAQLALQKLKASATLMEKLTNPSESFVLRSSSSDTEQ